MLGMDASGREGTLLGSRRILGGVQEQRLRPHFATDVVLGSTCGCSGLLAASRVNFIFSVVEAIFKGASIQVGILHNLLKVSREQGNVLSLGII